MPLDALMATKPTRHLLLKASEFRAGKSIANFASYLQPEETIVDVGAGMCVIASQLQQSGYKVTALDIRNSSLVSDVTPLVYQGSLMPFADKTFDTALLHTVLHHTRDPERILKEAGRIAKKIIIVEDIYFNVPHKYTTFFIDSLVNLEFKNHPHNNKTDHEWKLLFKKLDYKLLQTKSMKSLVVMRHKLYILQTGRSLV